MKTLSYNITTMLLSLVLLTNPAFCTELEDMKTKILQFTVPDDCSQILTQGADFLNLFENQIGAGDVKFKMLECEQDWDLIREKLHELIRRHSHEPVAEKASVHLLRLLNLKGEYEAYLDNAQQFTVTFPESTYLEEIIFLEGTALLELRRLSAANQKFLLLILRFPNSKYVGLAQYGIAESYFLAKSYNDALAQYNLASGKLNDPLFLARIDLRVADCYNELGEKNRSIQFYQKVIRDYPQSTENKLAGERLKELKNQASMTDNKYQSRTQPTQSEPHHSPSVLPDNPPIEASSSDPNRYTIQVGAFKQKQNAIDLLEALQIKGYDSYLLTIDRSNSVIYKIRIGKCIPRSEARAILNRLLSEEQMYSFLTICSDQ